MLINKYPLNYSSNGCRQNPESINEMGLSQLDLSLSLSFSTTWPALYSWFNIVNLDLRLGKK